MDTPEGRPPSLSAQLRQATAGIPLLDPSYRQRKLWLWCIRQGITITLAMFFWEHIWVRWAFALAVVLALFNLGVLLFGGAYLARKAERTADRIAAMEAQWDAEDADMEDQDNGPSRPGNA